MSLARRPKGLTGFMQAPFTDGTISTGMDEQVRARYKEHGATQWRYRNWAIPTAQIAFENEWLYRRLSICVLTTR